MDMPLSNRGPKDAEDALNAESARNAEGAGEILPVVDEEGRVIGKAARPLCHSGQGDGGLLHPVVRLWLRDSSGGFWLQKRSMRKLVQPGRWDCAVGGHVSFGESVKAALSREALEEIGLRDTKEARLAERYVWRTPLERELVFLFVMESDRADLKADPEEVSEMRIWNSAEIGAELRKPAAERSFTEMAGYELERVLGGSREAG